MKISDLAEKDFTKYFEARLAENRLRRSGHGHMALCCFHHESNPSLSVNLQKGIWKCHACNIGGGILDFEQRYSSCDKQTALKNIAEIVGQPQLYLSTGKEPEAIYSYVDANGIEVFQVVRYPGKRFTQRHRKDDGTWEYKTSDLQMVPYHLDEIICAAEVACSEGERDADSLRAILRTQSGKFTATTSPRGAGKWKDSFAPFFTGKKVVIFQDNDAPGIAHALQVANSVYRYANGVKIVSCPDAKDVSDYLATHTAQDLIKLVKQTPVWKPEEPTQTLFVSATQFLETATEYIDWIVEGLVERGANGLFLGRPKAGKSPAGLDLAIALASGQKWFDFFIPKRTKVAYVSREDHHNLTQRRALKYCIHRNLNKSDLDGWLYINAKGMTPKIMLDCPEDVAALIADLKRQQSEFIILDVMRVMHGAEENDNTEMQKIVDALNRIQDSTGCPICLLHHTNKDKDASLTESARGAGAIAGWGEFVMGVRVEDEIEWVREFLCEIKADLPPERFFWKILNTADGGTKLERVEYAPSTRGRKRNEVNDNTPF
jgi:putative DNA primase/helicase